MGNFRDFSYRTLYIDPLYWLDSKLYTHSGRFLGDRSKDAWWKVPAGLVTERTRNGILQTDAIEISHAAGAIVTAIAAAALAVTGVLGAGAAIGGAFLAAVTMPYLVAGLCMTACTVMGIPRALVNLDKGFKYAKAARNKEKADVQKKIDDLEAAKQRTATAAAARQAAPVIPPPPPPPPPPPLSCPDMLSKMDPAERHRTLSEIYDRFANDLAQIEQEKIQSGMDRARPRDYGKLTLK